MNADLFLPILPKLENKELEMFLKNLLDLLSKKQQDDYKQNEQLNEQLKDFPPVGFTYIQFPNQLTPGQLGFGGTWEELNFNGAFFRAAGGNAQNFENQINTQGDAIRDHHHQGTSGGFPGNQSPYNMSTGSTLFGVNIGFVNVRTVAGPVSTDAYSPVCPTANENRPINYTIRIWQRVK